MKKNFTDDYKRKLTEVIRLPGMIKCIIQSTCSLLNVIQTFLVVDAKIEHLKAKIILNTGV